MKARPVQFGALSAAAEQLFILNPGRGPKSNRTSRLFPGVLSKGKATKFIRTPGFGELTRFRNTENLVNTLCLDMDVVKTLSSLLKDGSLHAGFFWQGGDLNRKLPAGTKQCKALALLGQMTCFGKGARNVPM